MLSILALTVKKTVTLLVLVAPASMIPIFIAATEGPDLRSKVRFAMTIRFSVTVALLVTTFLGMPIMEMLGLSIGAMQVGGGGIVVPGKESNFKGAPLVATEEGVREAAIVPLAIPLLAGPAAFSYVLGNGAGQTYADLTHVVLPVLMVGFVCWVTFHAACPTEKKIQQSTLDAPVTAKDCYPSTCGAECAARRLRAEIFRGSRSGACRWYAYAFRAMWQRRWKWA